MNTVLQPFFDLLIAGYAGYVSYSSASNKLMGALGFMNMLYSLPGVIQNAPQAIAALEGLSDADRQAVDQYVQGKLPGVDPSVLAKIVAGVDAVLRLGGSVQDIIAIFKSATPAAASVTPAAPAASAV